MKPERFFELIVWLLIVVGGLVAAYVTFGVLSSDASGQLEKYSVGGAIAGALLSWGVLTSVYLQVRGANRDLEELRTRNEELQHKLIRGAPKPEGFTIEVDERQRIVLARPEEWEPKGGQIFDLEVPQKRMRKGDTFARTFGCLFFPIDPESTPSRTALVEKELKKLEKAVNDGWVHSFTTEMVSVGVELPGVKESLKIIVRQFVRIECKCDPVSQKENRTWEVISKDDFVGFLVDAVPENVNRNKSTEMTLHGYSLRQGGVCWVNGRKSQAVVKHNGRMAVLTVLKEDINRRNQVEVEWENPETNGLRSNRLVLGVSMDDENLLDVSVDNLNEEELGANVSHTSPMSPPAQDSNEAESATTALASKKATDESRIVFQQVIRMRVVCYNEPLKRVYQFEFYDDEDDFNESSAVFNQILSSVRFLD